MFGLKFKLKFGLTSFCKLSLVKMSLMFGYFFSQK